MKRILLTKFYILCFLLSFGQQLVDDGSKKLISIEFNTSYGYTLNSGNTSYRELVWLGIDNDYKFSQVDTSDFNIIAIGNKRDQASLIPFVTCDCVSNNSLSTIEFVSSWHSKKGKHIFDFGAQLLGLTDWSLGLSLKDANLYELERDDLLYFGFKRNDIQFSANFLWRWNISKISNKFFDLEFGAGPAFAISTRAYWIGSPIYFDKFSAPSNGSSGYYVTKGDELGTRKLHSRRTKVIDFRTKISLVFFKNKRYNLVTSFNNNFGIVGFNRLIHLDYNKWIYKRFTAIGLRWNFLRKND